MRLHQVLHDLERLQSLIIAGLRAQQLHFWKLLERVVEAAHAVGVSEGAFDALKGNHIAFATQCFEEIDRGLKTQAIIVNAGKGYEFAAGRPIGHTDDGDVSRIHIFDGWHQRLVVDRSENDRVGLPDDCIVDLAELLWNTVRLGRNILNKLGVVSFRRSCSADADRLKKRVRLIFGEDGKRFAIGRRRPV